MLWNDIIFMEKNFMMAEKMVIKSGFFRYSNNKVSCCISSRFLYFWKKQKLFIIFFSRKKDFIVPLWSCRFRVRRSEDIYWTDPPTILTAAGFWKPEARPRETKSTSTSFLLLDQHGRLWRESHTNFLILTSVEKFIQSF